MKTRKLLLAIVSILCVALIGGSVMTFAGEAASEIDAIQEKGKLVVGITDFAPMDYKDENGEWIGFDADLARLFGEMLEVEVEFQEIDWDNKILELNAGTVDCIWNGMTLTDEVAEAMECSVTYALNAQVVVMAADKLADYADAESLKGLSIAVEAGSAGEAVAQEAGLDINSVESQAAALMEVAAGTSDACVIDKTMADAMTGEGTSYDKLGYELALSSEDYVVGFRKGSDLALAVDFMFALLADEGTLEKLSAEYDNAVSIADFTEVIDGVVGMLTGESDGASTDGESGGDASEGEAAAN